MAKISSIRQIGYTYASNASQVDISINPGYDPARTIVIHTWFRQDAENSYDHIMLQKLDANTIRLRSDSEVDPGSKVIIQLIEFSEGVTVQDVVGPDGIYAISEVDLAESFLVGLGNVNNDVVGNPSRQSALFRFIGSTQIEIQSNSLALPASVQVVSWDGCNASQYSFAPTMSQQNQLQFDVAIVGVDPTKAVFFSSFFSPNTEETGSIAGTLEFVPQVGGISNVARIVRNRTGNIEGSEITFFVVEFDDGTLCDANEGTADAGNTTAQLAYPDFGISPVIPDEFFIMPSAISGLNMGRSNTGGDEEGPKFYGSATKGVSEGNDTIVEREETASTNIFRLQYIRPSPTGLPPPTPEDAYPGLTPDVITSILDRILYRDPWDEATAEEQQRALNAAADAVDLINYMGERTDTTQTNQFPRNGDTDVPLDIHTAIVYEAIMLLDGMDPQMEHENIGIVSEGYSSTRSTRDHSSTQQHILAGIMSVHAWRYLAPYLRRHFDRDINRA